MKRSVDWLCRAQDCSLSEDGGIASDYSVEKGWGYSYPEISGYIVPTFLKCSRILKDQGLKDRAKRILDWLLTLQMDGGAFPGGKVNRLEKQPVVFNTAQIVWGLINGYREFGIEVYRDSAILASDWIVETQSEDGSWLDPYARIQSPGPKSYHARVSWILLEMARIALGRNYEEAALSNLSWVLSQQHSNGWFDNANMRRYSAPLTHCVGYILRGLAESYSITKEKRFLDSATLASDNILPVIERDGMLSGRLDEDWNPVVEWSCLTGSCQIAYVLLLLYEITGETRYLVFAKKLNEFVKGGIEISGAIDVIGAVGGSSPLNGRYTQDRYPSWACKFFIDSILFEREIDASNR